MWYAGVGWQDSHYLVSVLDADGYPVMASTPVPAGRVDHVVALVRGAERAHDGSVACVIDSLSGVLERHLVEAGLRVYRADAPGFAGRPVGGSVPPAVLAEAARADLTALFPLTQAGGGLTGRDHELRRDRARGAAIQRTLTTAGRMLARGAAVTAAEVALTFDDGPDPRFTLDVLEVLRRHGALATFFCVGLNATAFPDVLDRIAAGGHEIGNHTWSHPYLPDLHDDELDAQLDRTNQAVSTVTGQQPSLVRPPYGGRSAGSLARMAAAGMTTVLWDVESTDWVRPGPAAIAQAVIDQIRPGSIVLMHDGGGDRSQTVAALPAILDHLDRHGYRCVPVSRFVRTACSVAPGYEHVEPSPERPGVVASGRVGAGRDARVGGVGAQS